MFVEVFESTLNLGQQGGLRCSVKAPTDSNITVSHNNRLITTPFSGEDSNCDHTPQISTSTQPLEEGFTLFSVTIHVKFSQECSTCIYTMHTLPQGIIIGAVGICSIYKEVIPR